jgi:hypothetical protein
MIGSSLSTVIHFKYKAWTATLNDKYYRSDYIPTDMNRLQNVPV